MAHVRKCKISTAIALLKHDSRELVCEEEREHIDETRSYLNYELSGENDPEGRVREAKKAHRAATGRKVRKDANVLVKWVVTLPRTYKGDELEFFLAVLAFISARYGEQNIVAAWVHKDESQPHIHVSVVPMVDGRMSASEMVDRADLRSFHRDLQTHLDATLPERAEVLLPEDEKLLKALSSLDQKEYRAAMGMVKEIRRKKRLREVRRGLDMKR